MADPSRPARVWAVTADLLLGSQITSAARGRGHALRRIGPEQIDQIPAEGGLLFVDLDLGIAVVARVMDRIRALGPDAWHVCAYGSHVDAAGLLAAKQAGADRVLSRSKLVTSLQTIFEEVLPAGDRDSS
jgi:hypothetical protein